MRSVSVISVVVAVVAWTPVGIPATSLAADTFNGDKLSFFAAFVGSSAPKVDMTLASLEGEFTAVDFDLVRGASVDVGKRSSARSIGTLHVGSKTYAMRVPAKRSTPVTVVRTGGVRAVLRSTSTSAGRRAFLSVADGGGTSKDVRVEFQTGVVKVTDASCIRVDVSAKRTGDDSGKATSSQGTDCPSEQ